MRPSHLAILLAFAGPTLAGPVQATTMTFESLGLPEGTVLTTLGAYPGVTFSGAMLVLPGTPTIGFDGNSSGSGAGGADHANSGATIAYPDNTFGTTVITFGGPVSGLDLELVDVEVGTATEIVQVRAYDSASGGALLHTVTVTGGDPGTGDGRRKLVVMSGFTGDTNIHRLEVEKLAGPGGARPGIAIDNIRYEEVPTPVLRHTWGDVKRRFRD